MGSAKGTGKRVHTRRSYVYELVKIAETALTEGSYATRVEGVVLKSVGMVNIPLRHLIPPIVYLSHLYWEV